MPIAPNKIIVGNCFDLIQDIPDNSIDLVVTSPPYFNQRNYNHAEQVGQESTPPEYIGIMVILMREMVRVIKPTGSILMNMGDRVVDGTLQLIPYCFAVETLKNIQTASLVNTITWVKSNPTPKPFQRRLVPSTEPIFHFVKSKNYIFNPDDFMNDKQSFDQMNNNHRKGKAKGDYYTSLIEGSDLEDWQKEKALKDLSATVDDVNAGIITGYRMKIRGIHALPYGGAAGGRMSHINRDGYTIIRLYGRKMKKNSFDFPVETLPNNPHPAIYPVQMISELIKLTTNKNDIVLDPFMGSGTTAIAAIRTERQYIGFELNSEYCDYAQKRIEKEGNL